MNKKEINLDLFKSNDPLESEQESFELKAQSVTEAKPRKTLKVKVKKKAKVVSLKGFMAEQRKKEKRSQNSFVNGLEKKLGVVHGRVFGSDAEGLTDTQRAFNRVSGYKISSSHRTSPYITGKTQWSNVAPQWRTVVQSSYWSMALERITSYFESGTNDPKVYEGLRVLAARLQFIREEECPQAIVDHFLTYYADFDVFDNSRNGGTLRNMRKGCATGIGSRSLREEKSALQAKKLRAVRPEDFAEGDFSDDELAAAADAWSRKRS